LTGKNASCTVFAGYEAHGSAHVDVHADANVHPWAASSGLATVIRDKAAEQQATHGSTQRAWVLFCPKKS
jgi:hypothetical protein